MDSRTLSSWWNILNNLDLTTLIARVVKGSLDIKEARARIRKTRASRGIAKADFFRTLETTGFATWSRSSEDKGARETCYFYTIGFDSYWELDLFGGAQRSVD